MARSIYTRYSMWKETAVIQSNLKSIPSILNPSTRDTEQHTGAQTNLLCYLWAHRKANGWSSSRRINTTMHPITFTQHNTNTFKYANTSAQSQRSSSPCEANASNSSLPNDTVGNDEYDTNHMYYSTKLLLLHWGFGDGREWSCHPQGKENIVAAK